MDFNNLQEVIQPLFDMVCCADHVDYVVNSDLLLKQVDTTDLVTKLNQAATAISYLKQNCLQTMEAVYTNGKSAFSISFGEWKNYINIVESTLMNQIGPVYCI